MSERAREGRGEVERGGRVTEIEREGGGREREGGDGERERGGRGRERGERGGGRERAEGTRTRKLYFTRIIV